MSIWPVLLRMLLVVGLILNGSGYAAASVHGGVDHATAHPVAGLAEAAIPAVPCDGHEDPGAVRNAVASDPMVDGSAMAEAAQQCCDGAMECGCPCALQALSAMIATACSREPAVGCEQASRTTRVDHVSPTLPHLIRPPIG